MDDLVEALSEQLTGLVQGSLPPEAFRQWLSSSMLRFESNADPALIDLAFSLELLGFEYQRGDRTPRDFIEAVEDEVNSSSILRLVVRPVAESRKSA